MPGTLTPEWIDTSDGVHRAAERCARAKRIALDTEADSMHSYFHKVCLIQVSANGHHMVIDPLAMDAADLRPLWEVVGDPGVPVLMHGADYDIRILDRDYDARVCGLQDTQIMAQLLGEEKTGLAALLEKELGVVLDKKYQRADWGRRPLKEAQLAYAAADTAHLGREVGVGGGRISEIGGRAPHTERHRPAPVRTHQGRPLFARQSPGPALHSLSVERSTRPEQGRAAVQDSRQQTIDVDGE
jgi:ribonuclease D